MTDDDVVQAVQDAIIRVKADVVTLAPHQVGPERILSEPPIFLDSLEFVAMATHLESVLGLVADDEHLDPGSMRTVRDVVDAVHRWVAAAGKASS